jgi:hypothetical protein
VFTAGIKKRIASEGDSYDDMDKYCVIAIAIVHNKW